VTETEFVFVYSTFPDTESAKLVAERLVGERLAACVNIYPPMISIYEWQEKLDVAHEVAVFIKTRRVLADRVIHIAQGAHPYSTPCFLVLPIDGGNDDYIAWARKQTRSEPA